MILDVDAGDPFAGFVLLDDAGRVRSLWLRTSARDPLTAILQVAFFCLGGMLWCYLVCLSRRIHHSRCQVLGWVHQQVYLHPYPKELMLQNHV